MAATKIEHRALENLIEFKLRHSRLILSFIFIVTVFFSYQIATNLKIFTNFFELYPPSHPYIQLYKEYRKMFGTANVLTMVIEVKDGDIYNADTIHKVDRLTRAIMGIKGVNPHQIISLTHPKLKNVRVGNFGVDIRPVIWPKLPDTEEDLKRLKKVVYTNEGIRGLYVTPDDTATLIRAGFWEEGVDLKNLHAEMMRLQEAESDANHDILITGYPMLYAWIAHYADKLYMVFVVTGVVMFLLLMFYFRSALGVIVPMLSGVLSAIWGLGFACCLGYNIDPLILVVPMLLSARALSHSVQCLERYYEAYAQYGETRKAIVKSYSYLYKPACLSIVTDGLGVLTIAVCTIPIMQKLAFFSSFWIISIFFSVVTLNPILVYLFPAPNGNGKGKGDGEASDDNSLPVRRVERLYERVCGSFIFLTESWRKWLVAGIMIFICVVGGFYSSKLKVGDTSAGKAILYDDHPYNVAAKKVNSDFVGNSQLIVIAEGKKKGAMKDADSLRMLEDLQVHGEGIENVGGSLTITDIVKRLFRMFHEGDPKWGILPEEKSHLSQTFFLLGGSMAPGEMDRFISTPDYTNATVTLFFKDYNNQIIKDAISYIKTYIVDNPNEDMEFRLAGGILGILAAVNEEVEWSYWVNLGLIFAMTFLLCSITYRSLLAALILIIPLAISQILSDNFMYVFGIDLNINSLPVAAIGVGIGVDYGIYILSRLSEEYHFQKSLKAAIRTAVTTTGKAVTFTATTLVAGVIFWTFSVMKFQAEMGMLLAFLMIFNMIGAILFIPVMISILGPDRTLKKFRI
jgi:predicted RND superfamily exporter protein